MLNITLHHVQDWETECVLYCGGILSGMEPDN